MQDVLGSRFERERHNLWAVRDELADAVAALGPAVAFDVSMAIPDIAPSVAVPRRRLLDHFPHATPLFYGHVGDGNLHLLAEAGQLDRTIKREIKTVVYECVRDVGGSISAEHGIGRSKRAFLGLTRSPSEIALMRRIKSVIDPANIMNPGKILSG